MIGPIQNRDLKLYELRNKLSYKMFDKPYNLLDKWELNEVYIQVKSKLKKQKFEQWQKLKE